MGETIRVLIVEDLPTDAELSEREIQKALGSCKFRRVETREEYLVALDEFCPALIISDYRMPFFDGMTALKLAVERCPDVPFIILTGSMNEDTAVECMKAGAWDYVIKEHVKRLGPAVQSALERQHVRMERKRAEVALRNSEAELRAVLNATPFPIALVDVQDNDIEFWSRSALTLFGHTAPTAPEWYQIAYPDPDYRREVIERWKFLREKAHSSGQTVNTGEYRVTCRDGSVRLCELHATFLPDRLVVTFNDITERKRAEESVVQVNTLLQRTFDAIPDLLTVHDRDLRVVLSNWHGRAHVTEEERNSKPHCYSCYMRRDQPCEPCPTMEVFRTGAATTTEVANPFTGKILEVSAYPVTDASGAVGLVTEHVRDITERKRAEESLRKTNRALRLIGDCNREVTIATNETDLLQAICRIAVERGGYRMAWVGRAEQDEAKSVCPVAQFGFEEGYLDTVQITWADTERGRDPTGMAIRTAQPTIARNIPTDPIFAPWREAAIKRGYASSIALPLVESGRTFGALMLYGGAPDAFDAEEVVLLTVLANDLAYGVGALRHRAKRERMEEAMRESEARFRDTFEHSTIGNSLTGHDGRLLNVNQALADMLGFSIEELEQGTFVEITHPDDIAESRECVRSVFAGERVTYRLEKRYRHRDGHFVFADVSATLLRDAQGAPLCLATSVVDISARKRAEEELRFRNLVLSTQQEASIDGILVVDANGKIVSSNRRFAEMWGIPCDIMESGSDERALQSVMDRLANPEEFIGKVKHLYANRDERSQDEIALKDGRTFDRYSAPMVGADGKYFGRVWYFRDITARKRAETALAAANSELERRVVERTAELTVANQELESFAYAVSHDLRAPLRGIDGWSQAVQEDCGAQLDEKGRNYLKRVRSETQRMAELIDGLLELSRVTRAPMKRETVDLTAMVQEVGASLRAGHPDRAVDFVVAPAMVATGDAVLLRAALQNLLHNAWKFTGKRPRARIEVGCTSEPGRTVYHVRDDGAGFDMRFAGKLFAPFQRLHSLDEFPGTGIGLATVQRIIHRHGGKVWATAEVDQGATFYFTLTA